MAMKAKLFVDSEYYNLKSFEYGFVTGSNANGFSSGKTRQTGLTCEIEAIRQEHFEKWAMENYLKKYVEVHIEEGVNSMGRTRILKFHDTFLLELHTRYSSTSNEPISFELLMKSGAIEASWSTAKHVEKWGELPNNEGEVTVIEQPTPQITSLKWVNSDTQEENITEIGYNENASLIAAIENDQGGTATITIEKEDGSEFENGQKQLTFTESIADGIVELTPMEIKEQWEEFKTSDIDKLVAKVTHGEVNKISDPLTVIPPPKAIVDFRPSKKYNGEYGFDYMRNKSDKKDKLSYKDILGTNETIVNRVTRKKENKFTKYPDDTKYKSLKCDHYDIVELDWHKNSDGTPYEYIQNWLTIYPGQTVTLSLQVETIENLKELDFSLEFDNGYFKLNKDTITAQGKKNKKKRLNDFLTIECVKEFSTDQVIKVMHGKRLLGQLNIRKNAKINRKKAEVVFVKVKTEIYDGKKITGSTQNKNGDNENVMLDKFLKQAYTSLDFNIQEFDLTELNTTTNKLKYPDFNKDFLLLDKSQTPPEKILNKYHNTDQSKNLVKFMEAKFNTAYPQYTNHFKVFFFADRGGRKVFKWETVGGRKVRKDTGKIAGLGGYAKAINSQAVIVFSGRSEATVTHELLHAIGLHHSFEDNANEYSFEKAVTTNIMDYSHTKGIDRNQIWLWQMKKLWANNNLKAE